MGRTATVVLALAAGLALAGGVRADDLDAVRALIGDFKVRIEHKSELTKSEDGSKPPLRSESWAFIAGGVHPTVRYSRYLNQPPDFTGSTPSLTGGDISIGLDGGPFGNWYRGGAIRVILDGQDVFAARPATRCDAREEASGHLRLVWELAQGRRLALHFTVPEDGRAVFARIDLEPGDKAIAQLEVHLTCYPGGFGPAYGLPSHRFAKTAGAAAEVPPGFTVSDTNPFPVVPIADGDDHVLYGDRVCSSSCLALLLNRAEHASGQVNLSSYGVSTRLAYPPATRQIHLGFFASSLETASAEARFLAGLEQERAALTTLPYGTE